VSYSVQLVNLCLGGTVVKLHAVESVDSTTTTTTTTSKEHIERVFIQRDNCCHYAATVNITGSSVIKSINNAVTGEYK